MHIPEAACTDDVCQRIKHTYEHKRAWTQWARTHGAGHMPADVYARLFTHTWWRSASRALVAALARAALTKKTCEES